MRCWLMAAIVAAAHMATDATAAAARTRSHLPRPSAASLLAAAPIAPNGTLIRDAERLRTLELDELAPQRLRHSIPF